MNNKLNNMMQEFLKDAKSEEELKERMAEFVQKYNSGEIKYENTPLDEAYELLEKAEEAKTEKQAIKLAKEAYKKSPRCLDAILFQVDLEEKSSKRFQMLNEALKYEESQLKEEGYFSKEKIGVFYTMFETRPYIRGLYDKANYLIMDGKYKQAIEVCKEILKLNESDNLGARYLLMAIYALFEDEKEVLKLYKKYPEENLEMLFPLFALYYKLGNDEKACEYLKKINKLNPHFIKLFNKTIKIDESALLGAYRIGDASEVLSYFGQYVFLIITMPNLDQYVLENSKKK